MIELKDIGERLVSIVSVEHYALGLLKMLEDKSQKEVANYIGVSQSKLSPIVQLLTEIYINKPCVIVKYISTYTNPVQHYLVEITPETITQIKDNFIDIFKFDLATWTVLKKDLALVTDLDTTFKYIPIDKLPKITIDALHNLEYKHKA